MKKKLLLFVIMVMALNSVACGKKEDVAEKKTLILGTSADYPPFEFIVLDDKGEKKYVGIDISLANKLAEDKGLELKIVNMSFDNLMAGLQKGEIDMVIAALEKNDERSKVASFSDSYYTDYPPEILVKAKDADKYTSIESLKGKTVGAQMGTTKADIVTKDMKGSTLLSLSNVTDLVNNLEYNKCDAIVVDGAVAKKYDEENDNLKIADIELGKTASYCVAVKKDDPLKLLESFNKTISEVLSNDTIKKWIDESDAISDKAVK